MSNRARRQHLFRQRMHAAVWAGTLGDIEQLGDVRYAFRAIQRDPLRMPNLKSMDNLLDIQDRNARPDDDFDLLDDDLELLHEGLHDFIGWEDYMEAIERAEQAFDEARDILEPLRRVERRKFNWPVFAGFPGMDDEAYLEDAVDYIAPIRRAAREIWRYAGSISQYAGRYDPVDTAHSFLPSARDNPRGEQDPIWLPRNVKRSSGVEPGRWIKGQLWLPRRFKVPSDRVPRYAALALLSMHEAYQASMTFQKIVRGLEEERHAGIDIEDGKAVTRMRERLAGFERGESRYAYALLDDAKDYLAAARLAVAQELGADELQRQLEKAQAQAASNNAPPIERRKKEVLIRELEHRWPTIADDMRKYEPWIRAAKLPGHGYWDLDALLRAGREKGKLIDEGVPQINPLEAYNRRKRSV